MKRQGKLFNKLKRKVSAFTLVMLVLQPLLMVGVMPTKAFAATGSIEVQPSSQDARVEEDHPDSNYGNLIDLKVKSDIDEEEEEGKNKRSYVQFELSEVSIPEGAVIDSAEMSIYLQVAPGGAPRVYGAYRVDETWDESSITWNAQPSVASVATSTVGTGAENTWVSWDVTADVANILNDIEANNGWLIKDESENSSIGRESRFRSSEYGTALLRPKLTINYSSKPTSTIVTPEENTYYNNIAEDEQQWPGEISGTASTPIGEIKKVDVAIQNSGGEYWDGEGWVAGETWNEADGTDEWSYGFDPTEDDTFTIQSRATDDQDDTEDDDMIENVTYDTTVPTFEAPTVTPDPANQNNKTVEIEIVASEELQQKKIVNPENLEAEVLETCDECGVTLTIGEKSYPLYDVTVEDLIEDNKYHFTYDISEIANGDTVNFEFKGTDLAGNLGTEDGSFTLDNVVPGKVTDLKAVPGNGKVDLSWKNPTDGDLANIQIVRNGTVLATLASTVTTYSDTAVVNGTSYTYDVYAVDTAGNKSDKVSDSATPAASQAISAASTSRVTSAISTETFKPKPVEQGEVKAAEITKDDENKTDDNGTEVKETKRIPVWGIIFLLILAAIGGYLFYVQNPENKKH